MDTPPASQAMAAILTALHALADEQHMPSSEEVIATRVRLSPQLVHFHLVGMERLGLVRRVAARGRRTGWLLAD